ncbi:hypothetical protein [Nocardia bovistercoris]|uniref:Uncharacterized protein n=1 Tax=Nocardia bovistercoris TaxID=2785916 RepID=A0A931IF56_9NOCA|nr:hypothetical protein [Nocardia bovistercoris]MBH0780131.1 hypothetical protein [Nocardia bovistercoris]
MKRFLIAIVALVLTFSVLDYARSDDFNGFVVLAGIIAAFMLIRHVMG